MFTGVEQKNLKKATKGSCTSSLDFIPSRPNDVLFKLR